MRRLIGITCLGFVLALAGCGEEPVEPKPLDTASTTPTPTVSPAPSMPPEASKPGAKGAEAFVRHYVQLMNHAQATGDTSGMDGVSAPGCTSCANTSKYVHRIYESGGTIEGGEMSITKQKPVVVLSPDSNRFASVDVKMSIAPGEVHEAGRTQRGKSAVVFVTFALSHVDEQWQVDSWNRVQ